MTEYPLDSLVLEWLEGEGELSGFWSNHGYDGTNHEVTTIKVGS